VVRPTLLVALLLAALLAGCGGDDTSTTSTRSPAAAPRPATLLLDFTPNAVHTGIYVATQRGLDVREGVKLTVRAPSASTDAVRLLLGGRAQLAILDIHDLAIARAKGRDLVGVMAIVQRPLAAILTRPGIARPKDLEGRRVGVTGLPSDDAVLDSIVRGDGGDPAKVRRTTIGFNAVASVLSGKVAGATAFWNAEGVALRRRMPKAGEFRVDAYGAPAYPELVLTTSRATLRRDPALIRGAVRALTAGYRATVADPAAALADLQAGVPDLDADAERTSLTALHDAFTADGAVGVLDPARLRAWATWEARFGIVEEAPDVGAAFDGRFVPGA
jgi:ABC-type nitrate/sulfonate/bicarbonate transport system substrate-binding protein